MKLDELRESGLLELYVLNDLGPEDRALVEDALAQHPELKTELQAIESSLETYARLHAVPPPPSVWASIQSKLPPQTGRPASGMKLPSFLWPFLFLVTLAGLTWMYKTMSDTSEDINRQLVECRQENEAAAERIALLDQLNDANNAIVAVAATEKYPETRMYVHNNEVSGTLFLQVQNLPDLGEDQSFQLWSLKADSDPIPLDVFDGSAVLFQARHVPQTNAYAITIEPKGGSQVPTLTNLIGVFTLPG